MIRALFLRNLRQHMGLLGVLTVGLFFFEWAIVWVSARIELGPGFRQILGTLLPPEVVETLFGQFGFASFEGAVAFGFQHPLALVAGVAMVVVMATLPARERETGFLDLLLARPLTRERYLTATLLLVVLAALLPALALLAGVAAGLSAVEAPQAVEWSRYLPSAAMYSLLLLSIGGYVLLFATDSGRRGVPVAQAVGVTLLFFWLDFMGDHWDLLETARLLSPFHYFDPGVSADPGIRPTDPGILGGIAVLTTAAAFVNFGRQNL